MALKRKIIFVIKLCQVPIRYLNIHAQLGVNEQKTVASIIVEKLPSKVDNALSLRLMTGGEREKGSNNEG